MSINEIQFTNIKNTWLDWIQTEPWGMMATRFITKGKEVAA